MLIISGQTLGFLHVLRRGRICIEACETAVHTNVHGREEADVV